MAATSDKVALIRGPYPYGPYEYLYVSAQRIFACVHACEGIPTEALESGVVREMVEALEALLPSIENAVGEIYYWPEYERAKAVLAKVRGEA